MLEETSNIGPRLELCCPRHLNNKMYVACPDDFPKSSPEGGCSEQCGLRLKCGHTCTFKCHPNNLHNAVKCLESCTSLKECGHVCQKRCHEDCGECLEVLSDVPLPCGHMAQVRCRDMENLAALKCTYIVPRRLPECGHEVMAQCSKAVATIKCSHPCDMPLSCGHVCRHECWSCRQSGTISHGKCTVLCGRKFTTCTHECARPCHDGSQCPPCRLPCEVRCVHNKCPNKCSDPCPPCAERCGWGCTHREHSCDLPCAVPCSIVPCNSRCDKLLGCGHRCPGVCGERCPEARFCQQCGDRDILRQEVEFILSQQYAEINVNQDPIIFLSCGHFYTRSTLDAMMEFSEYYEINHITETIIRSKESWRESSTAPGCPLCRSSLRDIHRYNRIVKKGLLDESTKRFVLKAQRSYIGALKAVDSHEEELERETGRFVVKWRIINIVEQPGFDQMWAAVVEYEMKDKTIKDQIKHFIKNVSKTEQPFGRVNALLASAVARNRGTDNPFPLEEKAIFTGFHVRGECLELRLWWAILWANERVYADATVHPDVRSMLCGKTRAQLPNLLRKCCLVRDRSIEESFLAEQLQAMMYQVLFSRLFLNLGNVPTAPQLLDETEIWMVLGKCDALFESQPGPTAHLKRDIDRTTRYCEGGTFHSPVTREEKRLVYEAMAAQFQGTGHWYYCRNNHPVISLNPCVLSMLMF